MRKIIREIVLEQTILHEEFRFETLNVKVDSRIETRTRDQNAIFRSLSLQWEDATYTGVKYQVKSFAKRTAEIVIVILNIDIISE